MIGGLQTKDIEQIYDEMTDAYTQGDYLEGVTQWGDDALMSPKTFAERFQNVCLSFGHREAEIDVNLMYGLCIIEPRLYIS